MSVFRANGLIAVCILVFTHAIWAMDSCPTDARALVREAPAAVPDLFVLVDNAKAARVGKTSRWLSFPLEEPGTQAMVDRFISLPKEAREQALAALERRPPTDEHVRLVTKLALYEAKTWNDFFTEFTSRPRYDDALANSLIPVMRQMPKELADQLHARLREVYPKLSKFSFRIFPYFQRELRLAPKRAADAFLQHTLQPDVAMAKDVAGGSSAVEALDHYFDRVRDVLGPPRGGAYSSREVLQVARAIQEVLRAEALQRGDSDAAITVTGSFANGRAKLDDFDLDAQLSDRSLTAIFPKIDEAGNRALNEIRPGSKLVTHAMRATTTEPFAAQVNPAMLRISADKIEILMYPPVVPLNRDNSLQPYNYPKPTVYVLEKHHDGPLSIPRRLPTAPPMRVAGEGKTNWLARPETEPGTQRLVDHLTTLPPAERERQLADLRANPPKDAEWKKTLGLALYDRATWVDFLNDAMKRPQADDRIYNALVPVMQKMPADLRTDLLNEINSRYATAPRLKFVRTLPFFRKKYYTLAGKRVLDVMISHLTRPTEIFEQYAANEGPVAALDRYMKASKTTALKGLPNGDYNAEHIVTAAREMQKVLREKARASGVAQASVTIAGSFSNGRANPKTSDIDVMLSDHRIAGLLPAMTEKVNAALGSGFNLEVHSMLSTTSLHNAAIVNPIAIHISEDKIEIWVIPPFRPLPGDQYFQPQNYAPPQKYLIDDKTAVRRTSALSAREFLRAA